MRLAGVVALGLALTGCGSSNSTAETEPSSDAGDAGASTPCDVLPACSTPEPAADAYGLACDTGFGPGWNGGDGGPDAPSCCIGGQRFAACVRSAILGAACDDSAPASCVAPFVCSTGACAER